MIFVLVLATAIALVTRPARAAAIKRQRLTRIVPALDVVCVLALIAIPVLAVLTVAGFRDSDSTASRTRGRAPKAGNQVLELANTGSDECRNSSDRACGPFRWEPPPGPNAPLEISIAF